MKKYCTCIQAISGITHFQAGERYLYLEDRPHGAMSPAEYRVWPDECSLYMGFGSADFFSIFKLDPV
jgi:hypothetical protein